MGVKVQHGKFPTHYRHNEELKSWNWCLGNSILIGPFPGWGDEWGKWFIEIKINGKRSIGLYINTVLTLITLKRFLM